MFSKRRKTNQEQASQDLDEDVVDQIADDADSADLSADSSEWGFDSSDVSDNPIDDEAAERNSSSRSSVLEKLPVVAAAIVVLVFGAYFYFSKNASSVPPVPAEVQSIAAILPSPIDSSTPLPVDATVPPVVGMTPPVAAAGSEVDVLPVTAPAPAGDTPPLTEASIVEVPSAPASALVENGKVSVAPSSAAATKPAVAPVAVEGGESTAPLQMDLSDLKVRVEALEAKLVQFNQAADRLPAETQTRVDASLATVMGELDANKKSLEAVLARLEGIETKLSSFQADLAKGQKDPVSTSDPSIKPQVSAAVVRPTQEKPATPVKPAASAPAGPAWVLRAAQPGEAWVSRGTAGELKKVGVGDSLPGVGKIRNIQQSNGRWEIVGSASTIRQ
jgi:hypothetical protein